tara:strand:- start:7779 stop:8564 length:786 start_codon:yes stop_codon:yes gene_type:complete
VAADTCVDSRSLLAPLGEHRRAHIQPSKGKKRKRKSNEHQHDSNPPPAPEIGKHILIGINSVTRHLEALAAKNAPSSMPITAINDEERKDETQGEKAAKNDPEPLSIVILTHPKPSLSPANAHFPTLIHLSTLQQPTSSASHTPPTLLVPLPTTSDARLASALHIPRVGALAIFSGAPGAKALEDYVRERVDVTECKWVDEAMRAEWRGINVRSEVAGGKKAVKMQGLGTVGMYESGNKEGTDKPENKGRKDKLQAKAEKA